MRFSIPILALLSGLTAALPATSGDGRGATIWTEKNFKGLNTAIPGNAYCTDMYNIFGDFDGKARSIKVEAGYSCKFFTSYGCPPNADPKLEFGRPDVRMVFGDMGPDWDLKIHSAYCAPIPSHNPPPAPRAEHSDTEAVVTLCSEPALSWRPGPYITLTSAHGYCMNLDTLDGGGADKVGSLIVKKEKRCEFFTEFDCPSKGNKLEYGQHEVDANIRALSGGDEGFDNHIRSLKCRVLGMDKPDVE